MLKELIHKVTVLTKELEVAETVLNDGIEYDVEFAEELYAHADKCSAALTRIKRILVNRYGVVAV